MSKRNPALDAPLASYAPLPASVLRLLAVSLLEHECPEGTPFSLVRNHAVQAIKAAHPNGISTTWMIKALKEVAPNGTVIDRTKLPPWRQKGALRDIAEERPNVHTVASLIVWRQMYRGERMLRLAPKMRSGQPLFYVFVQLVPGASPMMAAYPFPCERDNILYLLPIDARPEDAISLPPVPKEVLPCIPPPPDTLSQGQQQHLHEEWLVTARLAVQNFRKGRWCQVPPTALLYSPYAGLTLSEDGAPNKDWLLVDGGAIRFFHPHISLAEIAMWEIQVARLDRQDERLVPSVVQRAKEFALELLAHERLSQEKNRVPWKACP